MCWGLMLLRCVMLLLLLLLLLLLGVVLRGEVVTVHGGRAGGREGGRDVVP